MNVFTEEEPSKIPWDRLRVKYIFEASGVCTTIDKCQSHLQAGAKKAIIAVPSTDAPMFVADVNEDNYTGKETVFSNTTCTINCFAPLPKIIHKKFGIIEALMTTVYSYTPKQNIIDEPLNKVLNEIRKKKIFIYILFLWHWRSGRAATQNIIPSLTDDATAIGIVIPRLNGKLNGMAFRVPTPTVSVADLTARLNKDAKYEEICAVNKKAADDLGDTHSLIFHVKAGIVHNDNEYGYSHGVLNLIKYCILPKKIMQIN